MAQNGNYEDFRRGVTSKNTNSTRRSLQFAASNSPALNTVMETSGDTNPPNLTLYPNGQFQTRPLSQHPTSQASEHLFSQTAQANLPPVIPITSTRGNGIIRPPTLGINSVIQGQSFGAIPRTSGSYRNIVVDSSDESQHNTNNNSRRERRGERTSEVDSTNQLLGLMTQMIHQNSMILQQSQMSVNSHQNFNVMPDLSKSVGDFLGHESPVEARQWLDQIEATARVHNWPESFLYQTAIMHLKLAAKSWFQMYRGGFHSWQHFRESFKAAWIPSPDRVQMWNAMQYRKQKDNENFADYYFEKVKLCKSLGLTFEETRRQISSGLISRDCALHALSSIYKDENELFHGLMAFQQSIREFEKHHNQQFTDSTKNKSRVITYATPRVNSESIVRNEEKRTRVQVKCFNCQVVGHYASKCPESRKEIKCSRCGESGHYAKICSKPIPMEKGNMNIVSDITSNQTVSKAGEREGALSKYLKPVTVNNIEFLGLIDPGSSDCTIKATAVLCNDFSVSRVPSVLSGFGDGSSVVRSCGTIKATISIDGITAKDVIVRIVPDNVQSQDVLIGRTFTELEHIAYVKVDNKLLFLNRATMELNKLMPGLEMRQTESPVIINDIELPPANINFVNVKTNEAEVMPFINNHHGSTFLKKGDRVPSRFELAKRQPCELQPRRDAINEEEIVTDESLSYLHRKELVSLINEYRVCVAQNIFEIGRSNLIEMDIQLKPGSIPVCQRPYRTNRHERETISKIVGEWKEAGLVRETTSPYASPVLLVTKKNGESRLVVDYRKLNAQTQRINFPLPNMNDCLEVLSGARIFATIDLAHGYLQLPLKEEARAKTAFITPDCTGEFTRAMFGLMNAPFYFSKMMEFALGPLKNNILLFYLDDVLVIARNWEELKERLRMTFEALKRAGLTMRLSKCKFGMTRVEYLGFVVSGEGIEPGPAKIEAIANFPVPKNVHEVRRFIGMASFFRRFVSKFAVIIAPLTELTRKIVDFGWTEKENLAFTQIKNILTS